MHNYSCEYMSILFPIKPVKETHLQSSALSKPVTFSEVEWSIPSLVHILIFLAPAVGSIADTAKNLPSPIHLQSIYINTPKAGMLPDNFVILLHDCCNMVIKMQQFPNNDTQLLLLEYRVYKKLVFFSLTNLLGHNYFSKAKTLPFIS